jgi:predicted CXXCH cytochrome family protein
MYEYCPEPASSLRAVLFVAGAGLIVGTVIVLPGPDRSQARPRSSGTQQKAPQAPELDPAAWGSDHALGHVPEYLTGDECLFCHRLDIGPRFAGNRHNLTIRPIDEGPEALKALKQNPATRELADAVVYLMGGPRRQRFLKPAQAYGTLDLLSTQWKPPGPDRPGRLIDLEHPQWNARSFGDRCAGCHATGVESATRAFSAVSLDCYVCHGSVDPKHSKDTTLVHLSRARRDPPRVVISICAQCHIRTGRSKSSSLPYPNTFVAGDNLFRDFQVDLKAAATARLYASDRHVQENVRDVVLRGEEKVTCLSCHDVHRQSSAKHHRVARRDLCLNCHDPSGRQTNYDSEAQHSAICGY